MNLFAHGTGHHEAAWRLPEADPRQTLDIDYYRHLARVAERGLMDSLFVSDAYFGRINKLEATTLLAALSAATERIGLIATVGTTYCEPYHLARQAATLDHISGGRAGWNIVTGSADASSLNFGKAEHPEHSRRYRIAEEFVDAVKRLWDGGIDPALSGGAQPVDGPSGLRPDSGIVGEAGFEGEYYSVKGPFNLPRPPQGYPVLVQAGSSESGRAMGARVAEVVFTAQQTFDAAREFYADLKSRLPAYGRLPEQLVIMPGLCPIVADTEAEARELEAELNEHVNMQDALKRLSSRFEADLSEYPLDGPVPLHKAKLPGEINALRSRQQLLLDMIEEESLTIRQFVRRFANGRGHFAFTGTAVRLADEMEKWFLRGAADGFNIMPQSFPGGLEAFVDKVIPELQNRKLFREAYEGTTLREHLGLAMPVPRYRALR
ncbi:LLM class flavin-dependent oxidoreductase [Paenibacillus arenilitoris]|uniref:LLM class flavin-dependent oxidoreductase n=1 Tax=Paenibacillus arenilitoris TaxID=2772299 RepID=UPI001CC24FB0|nr:LLM class flavin-dependent oxidoreductase [Paenibacillus arenilitoris]